MDSSQHLKLLTISLLALTFLRAARCAHAQDCQHYPEACNATQVLADFPLLDVDVGSDPETPTHCERYERTSLSMDGSTAVYNFVYTNAGDTTPINDTATFTVANNTVIDLTFANFSDDVYLLILDYVNGDQCFVVHCNYTGNGPFQYFLFNNPDSDSLEYEKCYDKTVDYSGGNVTILRDEQKCKNVPPKT